MGWGNHIMISFSLYFEAEFLSNGYLIYSYSFLDILW